MNNNRIAMYLRLSKEDEKNKQESNSISMQRLLITAYVEKHFSCYELSEYADDGFSGTNFNRPGINALLENARNGMVDCIIVKDFSRFARDYIELGSYLEQIFPFLCIRFISINDNYDSDQYKGRIADLDINFKTLLYDYYSKDISQKVRSSFTARKEMGQYISGHTPFGYMKSPEDRHMLIIKKDEAAIVSRIFELAVRGNTINQIAKLLNYENVKTPIEYKIEMGETSRKPKGDRFYWNASTIASILRNRTYVGDLVYDKTEKEKVGGKNILKQRDEWKIYHNHHEAIVSEALFNEVQVSRGKKVERKNLPPKSVLQGFVVCHNCNKSLRYKEGINPYFTCSERYSTNNTKCCKKMNVMYLEQAVLFEIVQRVNELENECDMLELKYDIIVKYINHILVRDDTHFEIIWKKQIGKYASK